MKRILLFVPVLILLLSAPATAAGTYVGLKGVMSFASVDFEVEDRSGTHSGEDDTYSQAGFSIVFGKVFKRPSFQFRLELENTMRFGSEKMDPLEGYGWETEVGWHNSTLVNAYLDFPIGQSFVPYVGIGAGLGLLSYDAVAYGSSGGVTRKYEEDGVAAAFQFALTGGVEFKISKKVSLDVSARYIFSSDYTIEFGSNALEEHLSVGVGDLSAGIRYYF